MSTNAIQGLYDGADAARNALSGSVGGQARVQEVLTPPWVLDVAREALGGTIVLDPCASSNPANWFATYNVTLPPEAVALDAELAACADKKRKRDLKRALKSFYLGGALKEDWDVGPAFVNYPFLFAQYWMRKCQAHRFPTVMLGPTRGHRQWFWPALRGSELVHLDARFAFVGHKNAFPAMLYLASYGCRIPPLGKRETHREIIT